MRVIGGMQSKVLMAISEKTLKEMGMVGNYTHNDLNHPDQFYYRSDHISFARKNIPVLFYSTGEHPDYHKVTDEEELIDYNKFLKMTRLCYKVGFNVTRYIKSRQPRDLWELQFIGLLGFLGFVPGFEWGFLGLFGFFGFNAYKAEPEDVKP